MMNPLRWFGTRNASIPALYGMIVAQARAPSFYRRYGVPDTIDGRFDMLVLHMVLVMRRLARMTGPLHALGQDLFDRFCTDLDDNLREMGVGDLAVPREMRRMAEAFYGRKAAYEAALAGADDATLENALARNIYDGGAGASAKAGELAVYVREFARSLDNLDDSAIARAQLRFLDPDRMTVNSVQDRQ